MKTLSKILFVFLALALIFTTLPANVTNVTQSGEAVVIEGMLPNQPEPWGWTAYAQTRINVYKETVRISVVRTGSDCDTCGISDPPFVPYSLTVSLVDCGGYKVYVNDVYWLTLE